MSVHEADDPVAPSEIGGYKFHDPALLAQALTHKGAAGGDPARSNERLEWIGDAVLQAAVTLHLAWLAPQVSEGLLAPVRVAAVKNAHLAQVASNLEIAERIRVREGLHAHLHESPNVLADAFEAVVGAIALDGGFTAAAERVRVWFAEFWPDPETIRRGTYDTWRSPRDRLRIWLKRNLRGAHTRYVLRLSDQPGAVVSICLVRSGAREWEAHGEAASKSAAHAHAAEAMLKVLTEKETYDAASA